MLTSTRLASLAWMGSLVAACQGPPTMSPPSTFAIPTWEAFRASSLRGDRGAFIVDDDITIWSEQELRTYYDQGVRQLTALNEAGGDLKLARAALTVNLVGSADDVWAFSSRFGLSYCISSGFTAAQQAALGPSLASATRSWSDRIGVAFTEVAASPCDSTTSSTVFNIRLDPGAGCCAGSFFPSYARNQRELLLKAEAFTTSDGGRDLDGIIRHELGHIIGFRHEHIWLNGGCTGETTAGARQLTPYDVDSVMHYPQCRPSGTGGYRQTVNDYAGSVDEYGLAPALYTVLGV